MFVPFIFFISIKYHVSWLVIAFAVGNVIWKIGKWFLLDFLGIKEKILFLFKMISLFELKIIEVLWNLIISDWDKIIWIFANNRSINGQ